MARPYSSPKEFVLRTGDGDEHRVRAADPQEAWEASSGLLYDASLPRITIDDSTSGEQLRLQRADGAIVRVAGDRTERLELGTANRYGAAAMLFFEGGFAALDRFGPWAPGAAGAATTARERGVARAARLTTDEAALGEIGRIWAASGSLTPEGDVVLLEATGLEHDEDERATLVALLDRLALERIPVPDGRTDGEIWVRADPRLSAELDRW